MAQSAQLIQGFKTGAINTVKNRTFQVVVLVGCILYLVYRFGSKAAEKALKLDQVNVDVLPSKADKIDEITLEEADDIVADCRTYFNNVSAVPFAFPAKNELIRRMLLLTDRELGVINNRYNNLYALKDTNLYNEIKDDYWQSYNKENQQKLLTRLVKIGAGKSK